MKKMTTCTALLLSAAIWLSGCSVIFPAPPSSGEVSLTADYSKEYDGFWSYRHLNTRLQSGYKDVYNAVKEGFDRDTTVVISDSKQGSDKEYPGLRVDLRIPLQSQEEAQELYTAFLTDNPQFFHIGNTYSYEGYRSGNTDYYNAFCLVYTMSAAEREAAQVRLEQAANRLLSEMDGASPQAPFDKELVLHDRLMELCTYETRADDIENPSRIYPTAFTAYGALVEGRAVCEGYSRAMQLLLRRAGIDCTLVSGTDKSGVSHMWNLVTVNGRNYHLDPTWNDADEWYHHTYFNLTTEEILRSHTIDSVGNIGVDTCTAVEANYYRYTGSYLDTLRRDDIAKAIAKEVRQGSKVVDLRFSARAFPAARLFLNNRALVAEKVNALLDGSGITMWNYAEYNVNETYGTLTLYPETPPVTQNLQAK